MAESKDLIVVDGDYKYAAHKTKRYGEQLTESCRHFVKILKFILDDAVRDDSIAEGFSELLLRAEQLPDKIFSLSQAISESCTDFQQKIDEADTMA